MRVLPRRKQREVRVGGRARHSQVGVDVAHGEAVVARAHGAEGLCASLPGLELSGTAVGGGGQGVRDALSSQLCTRARKLCFEPILVSKAHIHCQHQY